MAIPEAPIPLQGHCTSIHNHTLYAFSPAGFQSLPLESGAGWLPLPMGVSVEGGVCVNVESDDKDGSALYIVGGRANSSMGEYAGLQRYTYATKRWDVISPLVKVTQNRHNHGATYLNESSSLLVFAGSQVPDDSLPSSQTFLISTIPPFNVLSYNTVAPPLVSPTILPMNTTHAIMIGGSANSRDIFAFEKAQGWQDSGATLDEAIRDPKTIQFTLVRTESGQLLLEKFDLGTSPNVVTRTPLFANSAPSKFRARMWKRAAGHIHPRQSSPLSGPEYNGTLAPKEPRSDFSIAQSSDGLTVISGGTGGDLLSIFNDRENSWMNTKDFFGSKAQIPISPTDSAPTAPTDTPLAAPVGKSRTLKILGATLGAILGLAALLIIILILLRWQASRTDKRGKQAREQIGKEERLSFADRGGAWLMDESDGSTKRGKSTSRHSSLTSLQVFQQKGPNRHKRGTPSDTSTLELMRHQGLPGFGRPPGTFVAGDGGVDPLADPSSHIENKPAKSTGHKAKVSIEDAPDPAVSDQARSTGWSRYFTNNVVTDLSSMRSGRSTYATQRISDASRSDYDDYGHQSYSRGPSLIRSMGMNNGLNSIDAYQLSGVSELNRGSQSFNQNGIDSQDRQTGGVRVMPSDPGPPRNNAFAISSSEGQRSKPNTNTNRSRIPIPQAYLRTVGASPYDTSTSHSPRYIVTHSKPTVVNVKVAEGSAASIVPASPEEDMSWLRITGNSAA